MKSDIKIKESKQNIFKRFWNWIKQIFKIRKDITIKNVKNSNININIH